MFKRWAVKSLVGCAAVAGLLCVGYVAGCGGSKGPETPAEMTKEKGAGTAPKPPEITPAERLAAMEMMKELNAELFYEGEGKYELDAMYDPMTGKVTFGLTKARQTAGRSGTSGGGGVVVKDAYAGIYKSDRIQGPYALVGRFQGSATLPEEMKLEEVRPLYYRAVIYSAEGKAEGFTNPINVKIKAIPEKKVVVPKAAAAAKASAPTNEKKVTPEAKASAPTNEKKATPEAKGVAGKEKTETKAVETATTAKPVEAVKVAVVMFLDPDRNPAEFLERGVTEATTNALAGCPGLAVVRGELVTCAMEQKKLPARESLKPANLKSLSGLLDAEKLVLGSVGIEQDKIHLIAVMQDVVSEAQVRVAEVTLGFNETETLGEGFLGKIGENLSVKVPEEAQKTFKARMKGLMEEAQKVMGVRKRMAGLDYRGAIAEFEKLPSEDMKDAGLLNLMAQAYAETNDNGRAAEMTVGAMKVSGGVRNQEGTDRVLAVLEKVGDLKKELDLLGEVPLGERIAAWGLARELVKEAAGKAETSGASTRGPAKRT